MFLQFTKDAFKGCVLYREGEIVQIPDDTPEMKAYARNLVRRGTCVEVVDQPEVKVVPETATPATPETAAKPKPEKATAAKPENAAKPKPQKAANPKPKSEAPKPE